MAKKKREGRGRRGGEGKKRRKKEKKRRRMKWTRRGLCPQRQNQHDLFCRVLSSLVTMM